MPLGALLLLPENWPLAPAPFLGPLRCAQSVPEVAWGNRTRVMLDMGCGVASLSAYLEPYDVHVVSMAPKDEHEAQVQLALERGILALLGVMGTQRLPFPANAIDVVHCSRCRVPWHKDGTGCPGAKMVRAGRTLDMPLEALGVVLQCFESAPSHLTPRRAVLATR